MPTNLERFDLGNLLEWTHELASGTAGSRSIEEIAARTARRLYDDLGTNVPGARALALSRFYLTQSFDRLPPELQAFARKVAGPTPLEPRTKCLTLLGTAGDLPAWCDRRASGGHQAIPLPSEEFVGRLPMVAQLLKQLGLEPRAVVRPDPRVVVDLAERTFNVFHVEEARGSPFVPAQREFVELHGIRSVLGFGGMLASGDVFALILFSKVPVSREVADTFKALPLSVKRAILGLGGTPRVFR